MFYQGFLVFYSSVSDEMVEIGKLIDNASMTGSQETPVHDGWEVVIKRSQLIVWRRHMGQHNLYEYKGIVNSTFEFVYVNTKTTIDANVKNALFVVFKMPRHTL